MIQGKTVLGIIPARGGSKRIPRKNLSNLAGKPLIAYSIDAGLRSRCIDVLAVSTDDREIADTAAALGAQIPLLRPAELARDESTTFDVVQHMIQYYRDKERREFDIVVLLQPTSPLRDSADIDRAMELLVQKNADAVISVCETEHSPLWSNTLPGDRSLSGFIRAEVQNKRSQDLEQYYRLNGAIYICAIYQLLAEQTFFIRDKIYAFVMPGERSLDIDTPLDLRLCECLLNEKKGLT